MPYGEPIVVDDKIQATIVEESETNFTLKIDVKNPTLVKVTSMGFDLALVKIGWEDGMTEDNVDDWVIDWFDEVVFESNVAMLQTKSMTKTVDVGLATSAQGIIDGTYEFVIVDGYFTYTKLGAYWYYMIGLAVFTLVSLLFSKQKFYFNVGTDKIEVYATMTRTTLIVNGEVVEDKNHRGQDSVITHKIGEDEIKINVSRPIVAPNIKISVNNKEPQFTRVRQNCFIKMQDKK